MFFLKCNPHLLLHVLVVSNIVAQSRCDHFTHHSGSEGAEDFTNEWIARVGGGEQVAQLLALETGTIYGGQLSDFPDTYIFIKDDHAIGRRAHPTVTKNLFENPKVQWAEQLFSKKRQKRDLIDIEIEKLTQQKNKNSKYNSIFVSKNKKFNTSTVVSDGDLQEDSIQLYREKRDDLKVPKQQELMFNDELWSQEWYLHDTRTRDDLPKLDLNVIPVYKMGITGKGVKVSILDDGIEYLHDDLKNNYDPNISYDCNEKDNDPAPRYDATHRNAHGTRCAGEVAMTANNGKCGVGIAYGASIGGIKLLDGVINDRVEGAALGFGYDKIDIYSASWGPNDDGQTVEGPGRLAQEALERGITKGRNGKGAIFVFASGNGGSRGDNCNCDGYIGSIYTAAIGSASQRGAFPWYGEPCAATLAVTYSSGAYEDQMITTTDLNNECTIKHTGTSASAPLAAGMIALALEANKNLTWRDVQHLIVWTSEYMPLADNLGWQINGAGFRFDVRFGFGLMNAYALVLAANNWINVPEKTICEIKATQNINVSINFNTPYSTIFQSTGCEGEENEINFLEHIEMKVNIVYTIRGALEVFLTSPKGTRLPLLSRRKLDSSSKGFINWKFMSVGTWGEDPKGVWTIEIFDEIGPVGNRGRVGPLTLILHGTREMPEYYKNGPRIYNTVYQLFQNPDSGNLESIKPIHNGVPVIQNVIEEINSENIDHDQLGKNNEIYNAQNNEIENEFNLLEKNVIFNDENNKNKLNFETAAEVPDQEKGFYGDENNILNKLLNALKITKSFKGFNVDDEKYAFEGNNEVSDEDRVLNRVHHQNARLNLFY